MCVVLELDFRSLYRILSLSQGQPLTFFEKTFFPETPLTKSDRNGRIQTNSFEKAEKMGKPDFISILCLSLALLANPLIGMQYCTVHHHFLEKLDEIHAHAEHLGSWHASLCESCHETTLSRAEEMDFPAEICGCAIHEHSGACESMIPAEFFLPESFSFFYLWDSVAIPAFTFNSFSDGPALSFRPGQNSFLTFSSGKVRTHLLKSVLVI